MITEYKHIKVGTKMYRKLLGLIGACMKGGGAVIFEQEKPEQMYNPKTGCKVNLNYVSVKLEWNNG
jgi:hypothetical protein